MRAIHRTCQFTSRYIRTDDQIGWNRSEKEQLEDGIQSGGASRRADRQINIGRSRFIVMHPRYYCVSKTLYVYIYIYILVPGVCTCTAACLEFKGGERNRSARDWKETLECGGEENGIEMRNRRRTKMGGERWRKIGKYETKRWWR